MSSAEIGFLNDVRQYAGRIFFLLNKTDYLSGQEVDSALLFAKETLEQIMGQDIRIFPFPPNSPSRQSSANHRKPLPTADFLISPKPSAGFW